MRKLIICFFLIVAAAAQAQKDNDHNFNVAKNLDVFNTIYKSLDLMYVDTLDADEVVGTGINYMLRSLDPYTTYYPEEKMKDLKFRMTGKYAGIGSMIRKNLQLNHVIIEEPYANMPAAEVGLKKGDIILAIDDSSMVNKDNDYVSEHLRGDAGTSFVLKIKRPSTGKTMKFKVTRKAIKTPAIPYYGMQPEGVGYINLNQFTENCAKEVRSAFIELQKKGMKGLVLDLRNNGGGLENEAVSLVNIFVGKGKLIVSNRGKLKRTNNDYKTTVEPIDTIMPIVVLVNNGTASASEITSGAMQDLDRAVILGTRTYGKGLVQMPLDMPYNGTLTLTTNKYYIPSGRCIQAINYKHGRGGYTEHVPDSLTRVFYTANGREVRDGGGIMPDIELKPDTLSNIAMYLQAGDSTECMLNYEMAYIAAHPTIAPPSQFAITDAEYEEFKQAVLKSGFTYDRQTEKYLKELVKLAKFEGYYDDAKTEFDNLQKKLNHNLAKDLDYNKEELKEVLAMDILSNYYYQAGQIESRLRNDKQMKEAIRLINSPAEYRKILQPKK